MFGSGQRDAFTDPVLGAMQRRRGWWRGNSDIQPFGELPVAVPGGRSGPDADALQLARTAADQFHRCRDAIEAELAEHRSAYEEATTGEAAIAPSYVAVISFDGQLTLEFGYNVPWDEEHTLGARVRDGVLAELSGSVLEP